MLLPTMQLSTQSSETADAVISSVLRSPASADLWRGAADAVLESKAPARSTRIVGFVTTRRVLIAAPVLRASAHSAAGPRTHPARHSPPPPRRRPRPNTSPMHSGARAAPRGRRWQAAPQTQRHRESRDTHAPRARPQGDHWED